MTKGKEKGRSNAPPYSRHTIYFKRCPFELYAGCHCPTTFNCTVLAGRRVMRFTDSRLLSSAMFA